MATTLCLWIAWQAQQKRLDTDMWFLFAALAAVFVDLPAALAVGIIFGGL